MRAAAIYDPPEKPADKLNSRVKNERKQNRAVGYRAMQRGVRKVYEMTYGNDTFAPNAYHKTAWQRTRHTISASTLLTRADKYVILLYVADVA